jgi:hypothetical protein
MRLMDMPVLIKRPRAAFQILGPSGKAAPNRKQHHLPKR